MTKGETIEYAIKKRCQEYSLVEWCEEWEFTVDEFYRFLSLGKQAFDWIEKRSITNYEKDTYLPKYCVDCPSITMKDDSVLVCGFSGINKNIKYSPRANRPDWCPRLKN